jgi:hypothetical protein
LAILNDLLSYTQYSVQSFDIEGEISNEPFMDRFNNGLAGWASTFTLRTQNDRPRCLFELIPLTTTTTASPFPTSTTTSTTSTSTSTTSTTRSPIPTSTTTSTTSTTTSAPGLCNNAEFAVLQNGEGSNSFLNLQDACTALAGGGLSTSFGNLWLNGTNLNSSTACLQTNGAQYPLYTNSQLTTQATYNPVFPYVIMVNITYASSLADAVVMKVDLIGGKTYITQQSCA